MYIDWKKTIYWFCEQYQVANLFLLVYYNALKNSLNNCEIGNVLLVHKTWKCNGDKIISITVRWYLKWVLIYMFFSIYGKNYFTPNILLGIPLLVDCNCQKQLLQVVSEVSPKFFQGSHIILRWVGFLNKSERQIL